MQSQSNLNPPSHTNTATDVIMFRFIDPPLVKPHWFIPQHFCVCTVCVGMFQQNDEREAVTCLSVLTLICAVIVNQSLLPLNKVN